MALPTSELVKAQKQGNHRLVVSGLRESEISVEMARGYLMDDNNHLCFTMMVIVRAL